MSIFSFFSDFLRDFRAFAQTLCLGPGHASSKPGLFLSPEEGRSSGMSQQRTECLEGGQGNKRKLCFSPLAASTRLEASAFLSTSALTSGWGLV